jgi:ascorbate-specific PTS system EIIC-type component UlaA
MFLIIKSICSNPKSVRDSMSPLMLFVSFIVFLSFFLSSYSSGEVATSTSMATKVERPFFYYLYMGTYLTISIVTLIIGLRQFIANLNYWKKFKL